MDGLTYLREDKRRSVMSNDESIKELHEKLYDLRAELVAQKIQRESWAKIQTENRTDIEAIKNALQELEMSHRQRAEFFNLIGQHWWKVLLVLTPVMGFLIEIGIYLRHLPAPK